MIVLYVMFLGKHGAPSEELIADIEKCLEVLHAMEHVTVARRCSLLVQEVFTIAKENIEVRKRRQQVSDMAPSTRSYISANQNNSWNASRHEMESNAHLDVEFSHEDLYASLFDPNIINFVEYPPTTRSNLETNEVQQRNTSGWDVDDWQFDQSQWGGVLEPFLPF
jgi:hypothetical protein